MCAITRAGTSEAKQNPVRRPFFFHCRKERNDNRPIASLNSTQWPRVPKERKKGMKNHNYGPAPA